MGDAAADKIKAKADEMEKDLNKDKAKAAKEENAEKRKKLEKDIQDDSALLDGYRAAEKAARAAPKGKERAGIGAEKATEEKNDLKPLEKEKAAALARGDKAAADKAQRSIDLVNLTLLGKTQASDLLV